MTGREKGEGFPLFRFQEEKDKKLKQENNKFTPNARAKISLVYSQPVTWRKKSLFCLYYPSYAIVENQVYHRVKRGGGGDSSREGEQLAVSGLILSPWKAPKSSRFKSWERCQPNAASWLPPTSFCLSIMCHETPESCIMCCSRFRQCKRALTRYSTNQV